MNVRRYVLGVGPFEVPPQASATGHVTTGEAFKSKWFFVTEGDVEGLFLDVILWNHVRDLLNGQVAANLFQVRDMVDILQLHDDVPWLREALARWRLDCVWRPGDQTQVVVENHTDRPKRFSAAFVGALPEVVPF